MANLHINNINDYWFCSFVIMMKNDKINFVGLYLLSWLLILMIFPIYVYRLGLSDYFLQSIIYVACAGGLGGTIYSIRSFYMHLFQKNFREDILWWYIFRPFMSVVIGVICYFLILGGLLSLGPVSQVSYQKSILFYSGISFLAGFSFTQFVNKLEELAKTLFAKSEAKK